ncbi:MAG: 6,7-dimethyl-8-ribityllumazine synthase [Bacteroidetes bacterium]|nr:6,7-dimethyl-8-ribityllumazine synthase [Bacteroidota bacterium]
MANKIEGHFVNVVGNYAVIVTRWNEFITESLKNGAVDTLERHGVKSENIDVIYCPGAYEIGLTALKAGETGKYKAIITLGAVIRGSTPHFDVVVQTVNRHVAELNIKLGIPIVFGILTTDSIEQAIERAGTKAGNKGSEAALVAIEMSSLIQKIAEK